MSANFQKINFICKVKQHIKSLLKIILLETTKIDMAIHILLNCVSNI